MTERDLLFPAKDTILKSAQLQARAVARAKVVQAEIERLRSFLGSPPGRPFRDQNDMYEDMPTAALLASYDAEMTRLCALPGVMHALYSDTLLDPA